MATKPCSHCNGTGRIPRGRIVTSAELLIDLEGHWEGNWWASDGNKGRACKCRGWVGHPSFERLSADPDQQWEWITTSTFPFWMELES